MTPSPLKVATFSLDPRLVVVEAGAGSGKTYNLVRIVKKMSEEGRDISRVLLVTFTNAAALDIVPVDALLASGADVPEDPSSLLG